MDDLLVGADTLEETTELYKTSKIIINDAGMKLRKWSSNDAELQQIMDEIETDAIAEDTDRKFSRI